MATLRSCYGLCPLIDQHSLLGISEDIEPGHVIVTLGKNIAIKYKLSDQKQINSWRTKDKFSSPVVYDMKEKKYVAVFNQSYIRLWNNDEDRLDKQKKYKFNTSIHTIFSHSQKSFIVFSNGMIYDLSTGMEERKHIQTESLLTSPSEYISDVLYTDVDASVYVGLVIADGDDKKFTWTVMSEASAQEYSSISLVQSNAELVGHMLTKSMNVEEIALLTLWSDGKLYSNPLHAKMKSPGHVYAIIESLSCKQFVTMTALNSDYIALYGGDSNGEGATLIIYNIQFKVTQSKQILKLFTNSAKIWRMQNNLLLCVGQNLAVVPFHVDVEQLAALVGSHKVVADKDADVTIVQDVEVVDWGMPAIMPEGNVPLALRDKVADLCKQGFPESTICEEMIPEFIANNDVASLNKCVRFLHDIPEIYIAKLLHFVLTVDNRYFKSSVGEKDVVVRPLQRRSLLDRILCVPYNDVQLLVFLRKEIDIADTITLLKYIMHLLSEKGNNLLKLSYTNSENKLIDWGCLLLDANYQKILLSRDVKVFEVLCQFNALVKECLQCLQELDSLVPILSKQNLKPSNQRKSVVCNQYNMEEISLF